MKSRDIRSKGHRTKTVIMSGGLNQIVSNLELDAGELYEVRNYEELDGTNFGYVSTDGYERTDGQYLASSVPIEFDFSTDPLGVNDTLRENERALTSSVPGTGDLLGILKLNEIVYCFRSDGTNVKMYETTGTGFSEVASYTALSVPHQTEQIHVSYSRFQFFDTNKEIAVICTGNTLPVIFDQTQACTEINPTDGDANLLFPTGEYPYRSYAYGERLYLAFNQGNLFISGIGRPTEFDPATFLGAVFYLTDPITDMIVGTQALIVFCENSIHVIRRLSGVDPATALDIRKDILNGEEGGLADTAQKIQGQIVYASKEGITTLGATEAYGDFEQIAISRKVQRTFDQKKNMITTSSVVRDKSQYRLYFSDDSAIAVTFNVEKQVKGATLLRYNNPVLSIYEDSDNVAYFSSDTGFLYRRSVEAVSFDGVAISSLLKTAFYHYDNPVLWKNFFRVLTELDAQAGTRVFFRPIFNYNTSQAARQDVADISREGGSYDSGNVWGDPNDSTIDAVWGVAGEIERLYTYIHGVGTNLSLTYYTSLKHFRPHTLHNAIVNFTTGGIDW